MNSWKWNELEDEALDALHCARHEKLYLRGLRKYMDYSTGIVGLKRTVCEQGMYELLEELRDRGSRAPEFKPSRHVIQRMLKKLESVGLIHRLPKQNKRDRMLFFLPLASTGQVRPEEERTMSAQRSTNNASPIAAGGAPSLSEPSPNNEERTTSGTSGTVNYINNIPRASLNDFPIERYEQMTREWVVDAVLVCQLCDEYGFGERFLEGVMLSFRLYWCERGGGDSPVNQWNKKFVKHVEFCLRRGDPEFVLAAQRPGGLSQLVK